MPKHEFELTLRRYVAALGSLGFVVDPLRAEAHVEAIKDWCQTGSLNDLRVWFLCEQEQCQMGVSDIPLNECKGWYADSETGWLKHESGEFFVVQGVRVALTVNREVKGGWDQPIIKQIGYDGGLLGLLRQRLDGIPHYLIEAKAEPGNPDKIQISPTLQATFSNLKQAHGGRKPRFAEYFENPENYKGEVLFAQWMSEDGGRLHLKRNKGMLVEVPEGSISEIPEGFRWVSLYQLKALIKENSWVNPHIRGIISHL